MFYILENSYGHVYNVDMIFHLLYLEMWLKNALERNEKYKFDFHIFRHDFCIVDLRNC